MNGTDWTVSFQKGAICRSIMWCGKEVATVNSRGDFDDATEKDLAAGIAHAAKMHLFLRYLKVAGGLTPILAEELQSLLSSVATIDVGEYEEDEGME